MRLRLVFLAGILLLTLGVPAAAAVAPTSGPVITALDPGSCAADHGDLTLTVYGSGFVAAGPAAGLHPSVVLWNGAPLTTSVISSGELEAAVPGSMIQPGMSEVAVFNQGSPPLTTDATSKPAWFTVTPATPVIASLSPPSAQAGGPGFDLTLNGAWFVESSVVLWDSTALVTTMLSAGQLRAAVPASAIAEPAAVHVTVRNGPEGAPVSGPVTFTVAAVLPVLSAITPTHVWAGYVKGDLVLTATGSGFVNGTHILLDGAASPTTFAGPAQLTAPLTTADVAVPRTIAVGVKSSQGPASATTLPLAVVAETSAPVTTISGADDGWHNSPVHLAFAATDAESGVQKTQFRCPPAIASWTDGTVYVVPTTPQGTVFVSARALDWCDNVGGTATAAVHIDTTRPKTKALNAPTVKPSGRVTLKYRVIEPAGLSPAADVVVKVYSPDDKLVLKRSRQDVPVNSDRTYSFAAKMFHRIGTFHWYVYATDMAGNTQAKPIGSSTFTVGWPH